MDSMERSRRKEYIKTQNQAPENIQTACGSFVLDHAISSVIARVQKSGITSVSYEIK
jgi:hypothetical protein